MDEQKQPEEQQEIKPEDLEKELNEANSPEELMEIMQKLSKSLNISQEAAEKEIKKMRRKKIILYALELVISFGIMLGIVGLFNPFILQTKFGDLILIGSICLFQLIVILVLNLFKHPVVMMLSEIIINVLVALGIILLASLTPLVKFISEWNEFSFIVVFIAVKTIIMTTLKRIIM